jgi:hypothetical protein
MIKDINREYLKEIKTRTQSKDEDRLCVNLRIVLLKFS